MSVIVAIVGRPNVGKSTFFNRLTETRHAIVDEISGVTRDRMYGKAEWCGHEFAIIDTGGLVVGSDDIFEKEIRNQAMAAIEEASIILFMVDVVEGVTPLDEEVATMLRRSKKTVMLIANKVDTHARAPQSAVFYGLGLGEVYNISSINGSGTGELLDDLIKHIPIEEPEEEPEIPRFALVGRPNVGKSSLLNALLEKDRNIVTNIPGTTRDAIYTRFTKFNQDFFLVDTAGIRRKAKVTEDLEFYSVLRAINAIEMCDVCLLMIDATCGIEGQDMHIFSIAQKNGKGIVILINKWDLVEKETQTAKEYEKIIKEKIAPFTNVPILFISALTKQRVLKAFETAVMVSENRKKKIPTSKLNEVMLPFIEAHTPPVVKGKVVHIKFVTQLPTAVPSFAFFCNLPQYVSEPYKRYLENRLRENFDFTGVPIRIFIRQK
ncbi:MAG: ribosome biogenesis GTPase Der [Bacteroidota bacterium]